MIRTATRRPQLLSIKRLDPEPADRRTYQCVFLTPEFEFQTPVVRAKPRTKIQTRVKFGNHQSKILP